VGVVTWVSTVIPEEPSEPSLGDMARCATKANSEMAISAIHASTRPTTNRPRMLSGHHFLSIATVYARPLKDRRVIRAFRPRPRRPRRPPQPQPDSVRMGPTIPVTQAVTKSRLVNAPAPASMAISSSSSTAFRSPPPQIAAPAASKACSRS
jgi:hypothetical protein